MPSNSPCILESNEYPLTAFNLTLLLLSLRAPTRISSKLLYVVHDLDVSIKFSRAKTKNIAAPRIGSSGLLQKSNAACKYADKSSLNRSEIMSAIFNNMHSFLSRCG